MWCTFFGVIISLAADILYLRAGACPSRVLQERSDVAFPGRGVAALMKPPGAATKPPFLPRPASLKVTRLPPAAFALRSPSLGRFKPNRVRFRRGNFKRNVRANSRRARRAIA
ncbi:hypothetical protein EVAR_20861_1 [Eumeta japonica]|uniref:Secreted protein n=1 Tax=Eumeta variegata TaxID=151549 RepID=A0A4C1UF11_EUMVA|nr:hypothetical protein EVAR_20861_1 [Eumeta japonica]